MPLAVRYLETFPWTSVPVFDFRSRTSHSSSADDSGKLGSLDDVTAGGL